jgi:hypothetical protein
MRLAAAFEPTRLCACCLSSFPLNAAVALHMRTTGASAAVYKVIQVSYHHHGLPDAMVGSLGNVDAIAGNCLSIGCAHQTRVGGGREGLRISFTGVFKVVLFLSWKYHAPYGHLQIMPVIVGCIVLISPCVRSARPLREVQHCALLQEAVCLA